MPMSKRLSLLPHRTDPRVRKADGHLPGGRATSPPAQHLCHSKCLLSVTTLPWRPVGFMQSQRSGREPASASSWKREGAETSGYLDPVLLSCCHPLSISSSLLSSSSCQRSFLLTTFLLVVLD